MGKFKEYLKRTYQTSFASFIPNYYRLYYGTNNSKVKFCIACKESIEDGDKFVNMYSKNSPNGLKFLCIDCGKECAEIHNMRIKEY